MTEGFKPTKQVPGVYHQTLGDLTITAINDGYLPASFDYINNIDPAEGSKLLAAGFRADPPRFTVNAFVVHTPSGIVLIDSGCGPGMGPTLGRAHANLTAAGVDPADVKTILITHLHPDHIGGLTDADGKARFPNAELVLNAAEAAFWLPPEALEKAPDGAKDYFRAAQGATAPYKDRMRTLTSGEAVSGIAIVPEPGHTPGHSGWLIASGGSSLLIWGDIVHVPGIQFAHPRVGLVFDADVEQAYQTRLRILDMVATDRVMVAGMHLDFPTFGHVEKRGDAYGFIPTVWSPEL
jgi:glyoxylase-like metal-dependent hydrolase (beta-lactamase superfamily II)